MNVIKVISVDFVGKAISMGNFGCNLVTSRLYERPGKRFVQDEEKN